MTYTEWRDVYETLEQIAEARRTDVAVIIREATTEYVEKLQTAEGPSSADDLASRAVAQAKARAEAALQPVKIKPIAKKKRSTRSQKSS